MSTHTKKAALDALPEPARTIARDVEKQQLAEGAPAEIAAETAAAQASEWVSARVPGDRAEIATAEEAVPDREQVRPERLTRKLRPSQATLLK